MKDLVSECMSGSAPDSGSEPCSTPQSVAATPAIQAFSGSEHCKRAGKLSVTDCTVTRPAQWQRALLACKQPSVT